jgi:hypothetical protein
MERDGGGWTLVLLNNAGIVSPSPTFAQVVSDTNVTGTFGSDLSAFDLFLGVDYWNKLGIEIRMEAGASSTSLTNQVIYEFALNPANAYEIVLGPGSVTIGTADTSFNGGYHAGARLSTFDQDNDSGDGFHCATFYGNTAFWYQACWAENMWGVDSMSGPYWNMTGGFQPYGAYWVR